MFSRYAIYYTPDPQSPLAAFGAAWLGWDSATAAPVPHPVTAPTDVAKITATPRKYGFHGTIKPPMRLADGTDAKALEAALRAFCASAAPVSLKSLALRPLGRFLALVPEGDASALADLACATVETLDPFRAPPTEAELAKRRARRLSPAQEANLTRWGYPYVQDEFRFHLTLTGPMDAEAQTRTIAALDPMIADLALAPYQIDALTLLGEDENGMFHQLHRVTLSG